MLHHASCQAGGMESIGHIPYDRAWIVPTDVVRRFGALILMASIRFPCASCNKMMAVSEEYAGKKVRCPHCQQVIIAVNEQTGQDPFGFVASTGPPDGAMASSSSSTPDDNPFATSGTRASTTTDSRIEAAPTPRMSRNRNAPSHLAGWLLGILAPYAIFMTVIAIWYYMKYSNAVHDHPLEMIPDLLGEYQKEIKKDGKPVVRAIKLPPADQPLPDRLTTTLGKAIRIGDIEVTPISIEYGPWTYFKKLKNREDPQKETFTSLVMRVKLRNLSTDLAFYPTDPYFDRHPKSSNEKPYTLVDVDGQMTFGGVLSYDIEVGHAERSWLQGQENDTKPLQPGETRETVFVTQPRVFESLQTAKSPAVWRIQVRRGLVPFHDREIPVSAVVGVKFAASDVRRTG